MSKEISATSIEENKSTVRRFLKELLSTDNFAVADEPLSPDFCFYFANSPVAADLESYMEFLVAPRAAFPDRRFVIEDMIAEGDKVLARFTMRGTHKGALQGIASSAKVVTITGIDMIRLAGGKLVEDRGEVDQLGMMRQLDAVKLPRQAEV